MGSLCDKISTLGQIKSPNGMIFEGFFGNMLLCSFFYRFFMDFEHPGTGKIKQNHWRVVQNQGFHVFRKDAVRERFWYHFRLHFHDFGDHFGHLGRDFQRKRAIKDAIENFIDFRSPKVSPGPPQSEGRRCRRGKGDTP